MNILKKTPLILLLLLITISTSKAQKLDMPKNLIDKDTLAKSKSDKSDSVKKMIQANNDSSIVPFVKGTIYDLTGIYSKTDSSTFENFMCLQQKPLDKTEMIMLGKMAVDTTNFLGNSQLLCPFRPKVGIELTDLKGKTSRYLFALECEVMGTPIKGNEVPKQEMISTNLRDFIQKTAIQAFTPKPIKLNLSNTNCEKL
jgi:hypothetical protein